MFTAINFQRNFLMGLPPAGPVMMSSGTGSFPGIAVAVDVLSLFGVSSGVCGCF